jgi:hypothetical protein
MYQKGPNAAQPGGSFAAPHPTGQSMDSQYGGQHGTPLGQGPQGYGNYQQGWPPSWDSGYQKQTGGPPGGQTPMFGPSGPMQGSTFRTTGGSSGGGHSFFSGGAPRVPEGLTRGTNPLKFTQVGASSDLSAAFSPRHMGELTRTGKITPPSNHILARASVCRACHGYKTCKSTSRTCCSLHWGKVIFASVG